MALIEIQVTGARIQVRAWPILVAHVDLTPRHPQHSPHREVAANSTRAQVIHAPAAEQPIRTWWRHQLDHSVTGISRAWLGHVQFLQPIR